jgi:DNA repair protein RecO (recombination protein O)
VLGESDRRASIYTLERGKLGVRFPGVSRPAGKLKALSEPLVLGEYRLHWREASADAVCAGGALSRAYPVLRSDLGRLLGALSLLEVVDGITPWGQPSPEKFRLLVAALDALEAHSGALASAWIRGAFTLRLLSAAGFGVGSLRVSDENRALWEALHSAGFDEVAALPDPAKARRLEDYLRGRVEGLAERPLSCPRVWAGTLGRA